MSPGCAFCAIVIGDAPSSRVYEDGDVVAFMDLSPVTPGHTLVIPKRHLVLLENLPPHLGTAMFAVAHRIANALRRTTLRVEGVNLFLADGEAGGQEVCHTHLHVVPRYRGDGFHLHVEQREAPRTVLDGTAAVITQALADGRDVPIANELNPSPRPD